MASLADITYRLEYRIRSLEATKPKDGQITFSNQDSLALIEVLRDALERLTEVKDVLNDGL